jgi:hypothetical protein
MQRGYVCAPHKVVQRELSQPRLPRVENKVRGQQRKHTLDTTFVYFVKIHLRYCYSLCQKARILSFKENRLPRQDTLRIHGTADGRFAAAASGRPRTAREGSTTHFGTGETQPSGQRLWRNIHVRVGIIFKRKSDQKFQRHEDSREKQLMPLDLRMYNCRDDVVVLWNKNCLLQEQVLVRYVQDHFM